MLGRLVLGVLDLREPRRGLESVNLWFGVLVPEGEAGGRAGDGLGDGDAAWTVRAGALGLRAWDDSWAAKSVAVGGGGSLGLPGPVLAADG